MKTNVRLALAFVLSLEHYLTTTFKSWFGQAESNYIACFKWPESVQRTAQYIYKQYREQQTTTVCYKCLERG